jgi:hypothetical protein
MKVRDARTGRRHPHDIAADPRLDEALTVAETIHHHRLRRITRAVVDARLIGSPTVLPPTPAPAA